MQISFTPQRRDGTLIVSKAGDVLTINGEAFDFSGVTDGSYLPADAVASEFVQDVRRVAGDLQVILTLPIGANPPHEAAFPAALTGVVDGVVTLPGASND